MKQLAFDFSEYTMVSRGSFRCPVCLLWVNFLHQRYCVGGFFVVRRFKMRVISRNFVEE